MRKDSKKVQVEFPKETVKKLKARAKKEGRTKADLISKAIDDFRREKLQLNDKADPMIWRSTSEGCVWVSAAVLKMTGAPLKNHLGLKWLKLLHPDDRKKIAAMNNRNGQEADKAALRI